MCIKISDLVPKISWFPGHMYKSTRELYERLNNVDVFIEIRDARQPYTSMNYEVDNLIKSKQKRKIVIFNKYDLCNNAVTMAAIKNLRELGISAMPTSAINRLNLRKLIEQARIENPPKYKQSIGQWMMIGGMPNVGKSTVLNTLRKQANNLPGTPITKVTKLPGETRNLFGFKVNLSPLAWMVDTPGLMVPNIEDNEVGLKLSLVGCVKDKIVGKQMIQNYMVEQLHKRRMYKYMEVYGQDEKAESGMNLIFKVRNRYGEMDYDRTATRVLTDFREGRLGQITLDDIDLD